MTLGYQDMELSKDASGEPKTKDNRREPISSFTPLRASRRSGLSVSSWQGPRHSSTAHGRSFRVPSRWRRFSAKHLLILCASMAMIRDTNSVHLRRLQAFSSPDTEQGSYPALYEVARLQPIAVYSARPTSSRAASDTSAVPSSPSPSYTAAWLNVTLPPRGFAIYRDDSYHSMEYSFIAVPDGNTPRGSSTTGCMQALVAESNTCHKLERSRVLVQSAKEVGGSSSYPVLVGINAKDVDDAKSCALLADSVTMEDQDTFVGKRASCSQNCSKTDWIPKAPGYCVVVMNTHANRSLTVSGPRPKAKIQRDAKYIYTDF